MKQFNPFSSEMTEMQEAIYEVETFLEECYQFRRNVLSGKTEVTFLNVGDDDAVTDFEFDENSTEECGPWVPVTAEVLNSIVRLAKKLGVGGDKSPRQHIEEYIFSDAVPHYDPIKEYLDNLPQWDGRNRVSELFGRLPGITTEQMGWCSTWLRSCVAHWLGMDMLHGNECVPILIGQQGCGKSTFAVRLLPQPLRLYYLDHINFGNKFDSEMALTHNLLVNIDEFANMGPSQQGKLKQTLSKVKVNGRPIFGRAQEDRRRYASFLATTNDEHPLCDPTGSRRYLCLRIRKGSLIDNETPIDYPQLFAQVVYELRESKIPYWFSNDEVARIQQANLPYFKSDDMESMIRQCYQVPESENEGEWIAGNDIVATLRKKFPNLQVTSQTKVRIGQTLRYLGCNCKRQKFGMTYQLAPAA